MTEMIGLEGGRGRPRILSNCLLPRNHEGNLMSAIKYPRDTMGTFKERRNKRRNEVRLARNATMKEVRSILLRITLIITPNKRDSSMKRVSI